MLINYFLIKQWDQILAYFRLLYMKIMITSRSLVTYGYMDLAEYRS